MCMPNQVLIKTEIMTFIFCGLKLEQKYSINKIFNGFSVFLISPSNSLFELR